MKNINALSEDKFLKLFYAYLGAFFLIAAVFMPDRATMLSGLWRILSTPCKVATSWFAVGGVAATFLNMGLVTFLCLGLLVGFGGKASNVSTLAVILTLGFASWGINILNVWPTVLGVIIFALVKKEKLSGYVNAMMFSTGIAPLITDLLVRYPHAEAVGFNLPGLVLALAVGILIGFCTPAGLPHSPKVHLGFDLFSAALPIGMLAFFLQATLFKTMGVALPAAPAAETLALTYKTHVNVFCILLFGSLIVLALLMGCKPAEYGKFLTKRGHTNSVSGQYGNAMLLMNTGVFGLFILAYYNLCGVNFNAVTLGIIFCMLSTCNSGSHPLNVWPIMLGYVVGHLLFGRLSPMAGGVFAGAISVQGIAVGLCYANGLSPIVDKYGWFWGFLFALCHYILVTSVPSLHGGFCLYNGGFTAALICLTFLPTLEKLAKPRKGYVES